jgi:hypothetical protein
VKKGRKVLLSEEMQEVLLREERHCVIDLVVIKDFSEKSHKVVRTGLAQGWVNQDNFLCVLSL